MLLRSGKQPLQPPPKVGSLADVRLGARILAAQKKYSRGGGYDGEDGAVMFRAELDAFSQHKTIVVRLTGEMQARFLCSRHVDVVRRSIVESARSQILPSRIESRDKP